MIKSGLFVREGSITVKLMFVYLIYGGPHWRAYLPAFFQKPWIFYMLQTSLSWCTIDGKVVVHSDIPISLSCTM